MNWPLILGVVVMVTVVLLVRRTMLISASRAGFYLERGAMIVDVRNPDKFRQRHVPNAVNLPLSGLPASLLVQVPDKQRVLLLHCLGGGRSAVAQRLLRANGYRHTYNLGSLGRAERIARARRGKASISSPSSSRP
jgi:phage shock protein E